MSDRFQTALDAHQRGDLAAAERAYAELLAEDPDHFDALRLLGVLKLQQGDLEAAAERLKRATELRPDAVEGWVNLATLEQSRGDLAAAIAALEKALAADPTSTAAHNNLGNAYLHMGRHPEAQAAYREALAQEPDDLGLKLNLVGALHAAGELAEAEQLCREILAAQLGFAPARAKLAAILADAGDLDGAEAAYQEALQAAPDQPEWLYGLGLVRQARTDWAGATEVLQRAAALRPGWGVAASEAHFHARRCCDWARLAADREAYARAIDQRLPEHSPFISLFESDQREHHRAAARLHAAQLLTRMRAISGEVSFPHMRQARAKLTVGYLSSGLGAHATAALTVGVFEAHDHNAVRSIAYDLGTQDGSELAARVARSFDAVHDVRSMSSVEIAQRIYRDEVDVLVDLNGYTDGGRSEVLALRPAPVQVSWLAYPGTMGGLADYLVVDPRIAPEVEHGDYDEALIVMDGCYQPVDRQRAIAPTPARADLGLPEDAVVLACFNNSYKISPEVYADWMEVLRAVPEAVLWTLDLSPDLSMSANLRREAGARGVDAARIITCPKLPHAEYLARYRVADLVLDTFPYTAHTTASDALFAGCPLLTREGSSFPSRVAASILAALGLDELITGSRDDYRRRAIELASDPAALTALRERVVASADAPFWDAARYARQWEMALVAVHQRWLAGEGSSTLKVEPTG